ncbi:uncharacterized protein LOC141612966 [Silene latifolia]|uniref:uncharacterized protein LOC141612966 n=1 Tax=Silene latifolia TaxID=37657 RepID=UPI003D78A206
MASCDGRNRLPYQPINVETGVIPQTALSDTGVPRVQVIAADASSYSDQPEIDVSDEEFLQVDTSAVPVLITMTKVGKHYIADATAEEESKMSSAISISVNRRAHICRLTKLGRAGLDPSIIHDMISVAKHVIEHFLNKLNSEIAAA